MEMLGWSLLLIAVVVEILLLPVDQLSHYLPLLYVLVPSLYECRYQDESWLASKALVVCRQGSPCFANLAGLVGLSGPIKIRLTATQGRLRAVTIQLVTFEKVVKITIYGPGSTTKMK